MPTIFEKLENIESRYEELTAQLSSPEVLGDSTRYQKLARTHADLAASGGEISGVEADGAGPARNQADAGR